MKQPLPTYQHHHYFHHHRERTTVGDCCCCLALEPEKRTSFRPGPIGPSRSHPRHFHGNYDKDCQKSRQNMLNKIKHNFMPESNKHINTVVAAQSSSASTSTSSINRDPNEPPTKHPTTQQPNHRTTQPPTGTTSILPEPKNGMPTSNIIQKLTSHAYKRTPFALSLSLRHVPSLSHRPLPSLSGSLVLCSFVF